MASLAGVLMTSWMYSAFFDDCSVVEESHCEGCYFLGARCNLDPVELWDWSLVLGVASYLVFLVPCMFLLFINSEAMSSRLMTYSQPSEKVFLSGGSFSLILLSFIPSGVKTLSLSSAILYGGLKGTEHVVIPIIKKGVELITGAFDQFYMGSSKGLGYDDIIWSNHVEVLNKKVEACPQVKEELPKGSLAPLFFKDEASAEIYKFMTEDDSRVGAVANRSAPSGVEVSGGLKSGDAWGTAKVETLEAKAGGDSRDIVCPGGSLGSSINDSLSLVFGVPSGQVSRSASFEEGIIKMCVDKSENPLWTKVLESVSSSDLVLAKELYCSNKVSLEQLTLLLEVSFGVHEGGYGHGEDGLKASWEFILGEQIRAGEVLGMPYDTRAPGFAGSKALPYTLDLGNRSDCAGLHKSLSVLEGNESVVLFKDFGTEEEVGALWSELCSYKELSHRNACLSMSTGGIFVGTGVLMFALGCFLSLSEVFFK